MQYAGIIIFTLASMQMRLAAQWNISVLTWARATTASAECSAF